MNCHTNLLDSITVQKNDRISFIVMERWDLFKFGDCVKKIAVATSRGMLTGFVLIGAPI
jgi:hypothetical protein